MNSNQKKFKKEMEKGLKERNEEAYYKYIAQNKDLNMKQKKNSDIEQINNKKLTQNEYIRNMQAHDELVKKNITDISNITVPSELENYITQMNEGYQLLCEGYEDESIYLKTNQQKYKQLADGNYNLSNEKLNNSNTELTKVLDSNNIKHK